MLLLLHLADSEIARLRLGRVEGGVRALRLLRLDSVKLGLSVGVWPLVELVTRHVTAGVDGAVVLAEPIIRALIDRLIHAVKSAVRDVDHLGEVPLAVALLLLAGGRGRRIGHGVALVRRLHGRRQAL